MASIRLFRMTSKSLRAPGTKVEDGAEGDVEDAVVVETTSEVVSEEMVVEVEEVATAEEVDAEVNSDATDEVTLASVGEEDALGASVLADDVVMPEDPSRAELLKVSERAV